jgi:hypothetical protein
MKICKLVIFAFLVMVIVGCGRHIRASGTFKSNPVAEQAAIKAAQAWLASWIKASMPKAGSKLLCPLNLPLARRIRRRQYGDPPSFG